MIWLDQKFSKFGIDDDDDNSNNDNDNHDDDIYGKAETSKLKCLLSSSSYSCQLLTVL